MIVINIKFSDQVYNSPNTLLPRWFIGLGFELILITPPSWRDREAAIVAVSSICVPSGNGSHKKPKNPGGGETSTWIEASEAFRFFYPTFGTPAIEREFLGGLGERFCICHFLFGLLWLHFFRTHTPSISLCFTQY